MGTNSARSLGFLVVAMITPATWSSDHNDAPRERSVLAIDVRSGKELWSHAIANGGRLYFDLAESQVSYREADAQTAHPLRVTDGTPAPVVSKSVIRMSSVPKSLRELDLGAGLRYFNYRRGVVQIGSPRLPSGKRDRTIKISVGSRPHRLVRHGDRVVIASRGEIHSFDLRRERKVWRIVLAEQGSKPDRTFLRGAVASLMLWGDKLLVQARHMLFLVSAQDGTVLWRDDVGKRLGTLWTREGDSGATIVHSGSVAVVAFCGRVFAFEMKRRSYLWSWTPDTRPFWTYPVLDEKRVYLVAGRRRKLTVHGDTVRRR